MIYVDMYVIGLSGTIANITLSLWVFYNKHVHCIQLWKPQKLEEKTVTMSTLYWQKD